MNKFFLLLLASLFASVFVNAQDKKHELSLSTGILTTSQILDTYPNLMSKIETDNPYLRENATLRGNLNLTYRYTVNEKWTLNLASSYDHSSAEVHVGGSKVGESKRHMVTLAPEVSYYYLRHEKFQMYSGLGLGYTYGFGEMIPDPGNKMMLEYVDEKIGHINFQLNAIGLRYGKRIAGFTEVGFGYKGVANIGMSYQF
ncbi:hypothetical protein V6R21_20545 [Limibacter armeniacum]|uniref:hypothetical protein n=1 Tax=Limibacter armeniacum TaxID=466084 RepID=UPI002FE5E84E